VTAPTEKKSRVTRRKKKRVNGYNADLKLQQKPTFYGKDSSVAIMKIRSFNKGDFRPFTKKKAEKLTAINQNLNSRFKRQWRWTIK
jgi:hypothetical protein